MKRDPTPQGLKFINSPAREKLIGGAKRGSKTVTLGQLAILLSYLFPGNRILLGRQDFTDLRDTTLHEFWQTCPDELLDRTYGNGTGHNKGEREIRLKTLKEGVPSSIIYRGLGVEADLEKVKSLNIGALLIDEASEIKLATYLMLNAQLTWILPDGTRPHYTAALASNPEPGWVKERFIDVSEGELRSMNREFIPALPRHNPHLPPGWEEELRRSYDSEWVKKYLDGSWDVVEGTVFTELDPIVHNLDVQWIPQILANKSLRLMAAIDHAETGVIAATLNAHDGNNNQYVLHEYYEKDKLISEACRRICEMIDLYVPPEVEDWRQLIQYTLIDPSTLARTLESGNKKQAVADAYREGGAGDAKNDKYSIPVVPAWNALELGIQHLKQRLHPVQGHYHPIMKQINCAPHLYICRQQCPNTWKETRELRKKVTPGGKVVYLGSDHGLDTVRYVSNSLISPLEQGVTQQDISRLSSLNQLSHRTHQKFIDKFHKAAGGGRNTGSWY